jgi:hypothetical protein
MQTGAEVFHFSATGVTDPDDFGRESIIWTLRAEFPADPRAGLCPVALFSPHRPR